MERSGVQNNHSLQQGDLSRRSMITDRSFNHLSSTLRDFRLPGQPHSLLQGPSSRMMFLSDYIIANSLHLRPTMITPAEMYTRPISMPPKLSSLQANNFYSRTLSMMDAYPRSLPLSREMISQDPVALSLLFSNQFKQQQSKRKDAPMPLVSPSTGKQFLSSHVASGDVSGNINGYSNNNRDNNTNNGSVTSRTAAECKTKSTDDALSSSHLFRPHQSENWMERYRELVEYKRVHGHCLVPNIFKENPSLAEWVKRQRYQYKLRRLGEHSSMSDDRIQTLEALGFVWNSHDLLWEERLEDLKEYKATHGDCNVPSKYPTNPPLAIWVKV